jgi:hypothetical protein
MAEATSILGEAIGRPELRYAQAEESGYRGALAQAGLSKATVDDFIELEAALSDDRVRRSQRHDAAILVPTTLEQFARDVFAPAYAMEHHS